MKLNVVIARDTGEKNLVSLWVDGDDHIDIRAGDGANSSTSVYATNVKIERLFGNVGVF